MSYHWFSIAGHKRPDQSQVHCVGGEIFVKKKEEKTRGGNKCTLDAWFDERRPWWRWGLRGQTWENPPLKRKLCLWRERDRELSSLVLMKKKKRNIRRGIEKNEKWKRWERLTNQTNQEVTDDVTASYVGQDKLRPTFVGVYTCIRPQLLLHHTLLCHPPPYSGTT